MQSIVTVTLVVNDYDDAIRFYTEVIGFDLVEDTRLSDEKRWVLVAPKGNGTMRLLLAKASNEEQLSRVGNQTGGRVFLFMHTDDCPGDCRHLKEKGVRIMRGPVEEPYGTVAVFADLYGNLWDLIQPNK